MSSAQTVFDCHKISCGVAEGPALISTDDICFFLADPDTGKLIEEGHDLHGKSLAGKILVFPSGKGSAVVQDEGLFALQKQGNAPSAMIIEQPDTVLVFGVLLMEIPVVNRLDPACKSLLKDGVRVIVDADAGQVRLPGRSQPLLHFALTNPSLAHAALQAIVICVQLANLYPRRRLSGHFKSNQTACAIPSGAKRWR